MSSDITLRVGTREVFSDSLTWNFSPMLRDLGVYDYFHKPGNVGITKAAQLIEVLFGIATELKTSPNRFETYDGVNKRIRNFRKFVETYLGACKKHPDAYISVT